MTLRVGVEEEMLVVGRDNGAVVAQSRAQGLERSPAPSQTEQKSFAGSPL